MRFAGLPANVTVVARRSEETAAFVAGDVGAIGCVQADARLDRVRAFVKIQDGCSFSCNFCVIPLVRGASRSRSADAVLGEIRRRVDQGHREVVLTGINLGCFRDRDGGLRPAAPRPRRGRDRQGSRGCGSARSRSTTSSDALVAALRETPDRQQAPARAAAVRRRRRAARDAAPLHGRHLPAPARAARRRVQPDQRRDRRFPGRGRGAVRARPSRTSSAPASPRCTSFPYSPRPGTVTASTTIQSRRSVKKRARRRACARCRAELCAQRWQPARSEATSCSSTGRAAATATTTRRGSSMRRSGELVRVRAAAVTEEGILAAA